MNLYKDDNGVMIAEFAEVEIPFKYLSGYGVMEFVRIGLGKEPLCSFESRGSKGNKNDTGLSNMASKMLNEQGMEYLSKHYLATAKRGPVIIPEEVKDESEEKELERLITEQSKETQR